MNASETALVLIGFQNDYFSKDGLLSGVIEESAETTHVLTNTLELLKRLIDSPVDLIQTPIIFSDDYGELRSPVGLLKAIYELKAFRRDTPGAEALGVLKEFGDRIATVQGKDGFNAFSNTGLGARLEARGIKDVVLAGAVTSICIDSTGRSAHEQGFNVTVLSDCTCGRNDFEQNFYCEQILPLYAQVCSAKEILSQLG